MSNAKILGMASHDVNAIAGTRRKRGKTKRRVQGRPTYDPKAKYRGTPLTQSPFKDALQSLSQ